MSDIQYTSPVERHATDVATVTEGPALSASVSGDVVAQVNDLLSRVAALEAKVLGSEVAKPPSTEVLTNSSPKPGSFTIDDGQGLSYRSNLAAPAPAEVTYATPAETASAVEAAPKDMAPASTPNAATAATSPEPETVEVAGHTLPADTPQWVRDMVARGESLGNEL